MEGILLDGRYLLKEKIGVGGMAYVYGATDQLLKRDVAIKILKEQFVEEEDFLNKFKIEAQSSASLNDDNIVNVYDVGEYSLDKKTIHYIVMERIYGKTLKDLIEEKGKFSNEEIIYYSKQIAKALDTAHKKGIVHRDIKPANILINNDNKVKVTDFGIARVSSTATITYTSSILGTVHYISPEQAKGQHIDNRSDLYSLGVVMYEMATGKVPFDSDNSVSIAIKHIQDDIPEINEENPHIDKNISYIIKKSLEKNVNDRYQNAKSLIHDLDNYKSIDITEEIASINKETAILNTKQVKYNANLNKKKQKNKKSKSKSFLTKNMGKLFLTAVIISLIFLGASLLKGKGGEELIKVPSVVELKEEEAIEKLESYGFKVEIRDRVYNMEIEEGYVIEQSIKHNQEVSKGSRVDLIISKGIEKVEVPDLEGYELKVIESILKDYGLQVGRTTPEYSNEKRKNMVLRQNPKHKEEVVVGSSIDVVYSLGPEEQKITVPNVIGQKQEVAIQTLREMDLKIGKISPKYSDEWPENFVMDQSIASGQEVDKNSIIDLTISLGPKEERPISPPQIEVPEEKPEEENKPNNEKKKKFNFQIKVPEGEEDIFKVDIYNLVPSKKLVFSEEYSKSELNKDVFNVEIIDIDSSIFEIYYDGSKANIKYN